MHRPVPVLTMLLASCMSPTIDPAAEREALLEADRAFARETAARGVEGWLDFHLEDAHNVPAAGAAVVGHAAIRERMTTSSPIRHSSLHGSRCSPRWRPMAVSGLRTAIGVQPTSRPTR